MKLNVEDISFKVNDKIIEVNLPAFTMEKPNIDPDTLDFLQIEGKDKSGKNLDDMYKICVSDAGGEIYKYQDNFERLARKNVEATIAALLESVLSHAGEKYTLDFVWEE